ncbi:hypothetical protein [Methylibium sp.]|uniref:hypothetical protein n=1 Tax=Methylibium sp. TaxID=2067992 RepID=UPI00286A6147|nr:hypothetical protein [Methylibium sp.]
MKTTILRALCAAVLLGASSSHALVFAINEGVTYRVPADEIRGKYAAITCRSRR